MTTEIRLPNGGVTLVDDCDAPAASRHIWHVGSRGYVRTSGRDATGRRVALFLHRMIADPAAGLYVDHVNGDRLDNRRANLRVCTAAQNIANQRGHVGQRGSRFKGVEWDATSVSRPWRARITVGGVKQSLGKFETQEAAALAYDVAARRSFGDFAVVNFAAAGDRSAASG